VVVFYFDYFILASYISKLSLQQAVEAMGL
jgi:hypothetical protein